MHYVYIHNLFIQELTTTATVAMNFQWQYGFGPMSLCCTPHFKPDAEKPWVTRESASSLHYWYNPEKGQTLLEVVEQIEAWIRYDYEETVQTTARYNINILSMEIRGVKYTREELATKTASETLRNEEPFTLRIHGGQRGPSCLIL